MKAASTLVALAFFFISALDALTIVTPVAGATYYEGQPIPVLIQNDIGEFFSNALVTFASPFGSIVQNLPVGLEQTIYLPCDVHGSTTVAAKNGATQAPSVQIQINPSPYVGYGNPCAEPCGNPCADTCARSSRSSRGSRRSRRWCNVYPESADNIATEFKPEEQAQQQETVVAAESI